MRKIADKTESLFVLSIHLFESVSKVMLSEAKYLLLKLPHSNKSVVLSHSEDEKTAENLRKMC